MFLLVALLPRTAPSIARMVVTRREKQRSVLLDVSPFPLLLPITTPLRLSLKRPATKETS